MTVQADVRMPQRIFRQLEDSYYNAQWKKAVSGAVQHIESSETDCRVLNLGAGAGVQAVTALQAGARHVTAAERWLYLALASKETLQENEVEEDRYSVIYKRPSDLKIKEDVPVCCNLLIANILDEGALVFFTTHGLIDKKLQNQRFEVLILTEYCYSYYRSTFFRDHPCCASCFG